MCNKEPNHLKWNIILTYLIPLKVIDIHYFVKQLKSWNNVCLYPVDEWVHISGAGVTVDDHMNNMYQNYDSVSGALEFGILYALAKAIKKNNQIIGKIIHNLKYYSVFFNTFEKVFEGEQYSLLVDKILY